MNVLDYPPTVDRYGAGNDVLPAWTPSTTLIRNHREGLAIPSALVVSVDNAIAGSLCETLLLCGAVPISVATIEEAACHIANDNVLVGICEDRLPDGKYEDLLLLNHAMGISFPWIVVSRTGDWPEYLAAVEVGAHDFLAYPPLYGELPRIIRSLLETQDAPRADPYDAPGKLA